MNRRQANRCYEIIVLSLFSLLLLIGFSSKLIGINSILPVLITNLSTFSSFIPHSFLLKSAPALDSFNLANSNLTNWLKQEESTSWNYLLKNINPPETSIGCIIASPSKLNPNYYFQWTRDSALIMRTIVKSYTTQGNTEHLNLILNYIQATEEIQHKQTVIGGFSSGGLGEVKYYVNNEPFTGEWGRPQNDGPASRVITLTNFALYQLSNGTEEEKQFIRTKLYDSKFPSNSIIKGDLEHIALHWQEDCFDLWEEIKGSHFYTLLTIQSALISGSNLATILSDPGAASYYTSIANQISIKLEEFWSPSKNLIRVTLDSNSNSGSGRESDLDSAILLAILHSGDGTKWKGDEKFLATLDKLIEGMRHVYPLNRNRTIPALGRYPEDVYDGIGISIANPWYLCTLSAAEILYLSASQLSSRKEPLKINSVTFSFYSRFLTNLMVGEIIEPGSEKINRLIRGQRDLGDGFLSIVREFEGKEGRLSEQFDRVTGESRGARDLTWSYAAFITASEARRGV